MVNVNGKLSPLVSLVFFLLILSIQPLANLFQDSSDLAELESMLNDPDAKLSMLIFQGTFSTFLFIVLPLVFLKLSGVSLRQTFLKGLNYDIRGYILVFVFVVAFMPFDGWIGEMNAKIPFPEKIVEMERSLEGLTKLLTDFSGIPQLLIGVIVIAVVAGVGEELTFRAILQNQFFSILRNKHVAIWLSAIIFSAIHMQFLGFFPRMFLGAIFGYLYVWSGNITLAMFGHFVNNGVAVVMLYMYNTKTIEFDLEAEETIPLEAVLVSAGISLILFWTIRNFLKKNNPEKREVESLPTDLSNN